MTTATIDASALSDADHRKQLRRAVIASAIGTTIEWYDFFIYGIVTGLVFAKLYFPQSDPLAGTLQRMRCSSSVLSPAQSEPLSLATTEIGLAGNRR